MNTQEFEQIDINSFLDHTAEDNIAEDKNGAFTERQNDLINQLLAYTKENDKEHYETFMNRIMDLNSIDSSVCAKTLAARIKNSPAINPFFLIKSPIDKITYLPFYFLLSARQIKKLIYNRITKI